MKPLILLLALGLLAVSVPTQASPPSKWTFSGSAGVSAGDQTDPSFSWRFSALHWRTPGAGIGLQFGRLRWEGTQEFMNTADPAVFGGLDIPEPFQGLTQGGHELFDLSGSIRIRGGSNEGFGRGAPFIALGAGAYKQNIRGAEVYAYPSQLPPLAEDSRDGAVHVGWHVAFGGMGISGIAPGAEFRFDWVNTNPGPSTYFTVSAALHVNR